MAICLCIKRGETFAFCRRLYLEFSTLPLVVTGSRFDFGCAELGSLNLIQRQSLVQHKRERERPTNELE